jgi:predicted RNA-binding Zn ribbon-like protein
VGYDDAVGAPVSTASTMKLVGGDACLDFVNTVGGRSDAGAASARVRGDKLASYADLAGFAAHAGLVAPAAARELQRRASREPGAADAALRRARQLREALYRVLRALMRGRSPASSDLRQVNAELTASRLAERLALREGRLAWEWPGSSRRLESPLWLLARRAERLLTSGELERLRQCGGESCGWLFLDQSRNRSRHWCTMQDCGNVSKVRRYRERRAHSKG